VRIQKACDLYSSTDFQHDTESTGSARWPTLMNMFDADDEAFWRRWRSRLDEILNPKHSARVKPTRDLL